MQPRLYIAWWWSATCLWRLAHPVNVTIVRLGGSLSLTGDFAVPSQAVLRGIILLAETVNRTGCFGGPHGSTLALDLAIEDDQSRQPAVRRIYDSLAQRGDVHFLFGPHSSAFTSIAAEYASRERKLAVLSSGASEAIYQRGYRYIFGVSAPARRYMLSGLQALWDLGARTVSFAREVDEFNEEICAGASQHATRIGYQILGSAFLEQGDLTTQVRYLRALQADVCIVCAGFQQSVTAVLVSRGLGFVPKGMFIASAASTAFIHSVGESNANYIMGPVPWTVDANESSCRVFGSSAGFAEAYRKRWGVEPEYQSAEAAAAGIALLAAIESASTLDMQAVNAAMLSLDFDSFFARLKFSPNGSRRHARVFTQQVQPVAVNFVPGQPYDCARLETVGPTQLPLWPMPGWQQKEIEVYPCAPGIVWTVLPNTSSESEDDPVMACVPCPIGRYRHEFSLQCEDCEAGRYGDSPGLGACEVCPEGSDCPHGFRPGQPNSSAGYYKLPAQPLQIVKCLPPELCLGSNKCLEHNAGVLCWQCQSGSSNTGFLHFGKECAKCPNAGWHVFGVLVILLYALYIYIIAKATIASSRSYSGIHSVILKITVSYLQLSGAIFEATEFDQMVDAMFDRKLNVVTVVVKAQTIFHNPLEALVSFDCMTGDNGFRQDKANVLLGFLLIPSVLFLQILWNFAMHKRRVRNHERRKETVQKSRKHIKRLASRSSGSAVSFDAATIADADSDVDHSLKSSFDVEWSSIQERNFDGISGSIVWCFVLHAIVLRLLLTPLTCMDLDTLRLSQDLDVVCGGRDYHTYFYLSVLGIMIYGLGLPLAMAIILLQVRNKLFHPEVRAKFGFLYNGYELHHYYFETIYMLRKVAILCMAIVPSRYMRLLGLLFISFGFLSLHAQSEPFDNRGYFCMDYLERASLRALTVTVMARLIFDIRSLLVDTYFWPVLNLGISDVLLVAAPILSQVWFIVLSYWFLFRNTMLTTWHLRNDMWPEDPKEIGRFRRFCLWVDGPVNKLTFDKKDKTIDISALHGQERHYLLTALQDTLERYMDSNPMVHPGLVANAVSEAFNTSMTTRSEKAQRLLLLRVGARDSSWSSVFWRIRGEVAVSLKHHIKNMEDDDVGAEGKYVPRGVQLDEARRLDELNKHGVTVEELYNHLMQLWPEILEQHPRFFDLKILAEEEHLKPKPTLIQEMPDLFSTSTETEGTEDKDDQTEPNSQEVVQYVDTEQNNNTFKLEGVWLNYSMDGQVILNHVTELKDDGCTLHITGSSAGLWNAVRSTTVPAENESVVDKVMALFHRAQALQNALKDATHPLIPDVDRLEHWNRDLVTRNVHLKVENEALRNQIAECEEHQKRLAAEIVAAEEAAGYKVEERQAAKEALRAQIAEEQALHQRLLEDTAVALQAAEVRRTKRAPAKQVSSVLDLDSLRVEVIGTAEGLHKEMSKRRPKQRLRKPAAAEGVASEEATAADGLPSPSAQTGNTAESDFMGAMLQPLDPSAWPSQAA